MGKGAWNTETDFAMKTCTEYTPFQCVELGTLPPTYSDNNTIYLFAQQGIGHFYIVTTFF